jgi:hypothetical protein
MSLWAPAALTSRPLKLAIIGPRILSPCYQDFSHHSVDYSPSDCILDTYLLRLSLNSK